MKLSYRGVHYKDEPSTMEVTEGEIVGMYRDQERQSGYLRHIPEPPTVNNLKYRGVAYRTSQAVAAVPSVVTQAVCALPRRTFPVATSVKSSSADSVSRRLGISAEEAFPPLAF
ncbi:MAG TPA: DUF4278 domain-containing protein [Leptolyngbyaceae cyanobacterium]